jgi:hypothetical protein
MPVGGWLASEAAERSTGTWAAMRAFPAQAKVAEAQAKIRIDQPSTLTITARRRRGGSER